MISKPPQPEPRICKFCNGPSPAKWHSSGNRWSRPFTCGKCLMSRWRHGMTSIEIKNYLSCGCAIEGCQKPAEVIDHDHLVHADENHSCNECRRGPLCRYHNSYMMRFIDLFRQEDEEAFLAWEYANQLHPVKMTIGGFID